MQFMSGQWCPSWIALIIQISFHAGLWEASPQRFPLVKLSHLRPHMANEIVDVCQTEPTHPPLLQFLFQFLFQGFFFMTPISGFKSRQLWKNKKDGKAQQCYYWIRCCTGIEQHLTLCTHFASFKLFHPVSQSGSPSNSLWIKWYAFLNQKP